jgi:hypothetical protein
MCKTENCNKKPEKGNYCYACLKSRYRKRHPIKAAYQNLRNSAKRRGKVFDLTFEQFKEFAIKTDYIVNSGRKAESLHVDRIDENGPYSIDNIQVLPNSRNVKKYVEFKQRNPDGSIEFRTSIIKPLVASGECPF